MTFTNILEMRQLVTTSNNPSEEGPLLKATRNTELLHTSLSPLFFGLQISVILLRSLFFPSPFSARVLSVTPSQFLMNAWGPRLVRMRESGGDVAGLLLFVLYLFTKMHRCMNEMNGKTQ